MFQIEVAKEKGGKNYYCYDIADGRPIKGTFGDKKKVFKRAAELNGVEYKEFLKNRQGT